MLEKRPAKRPSAADIAALPWVQEHAKHVGQTEKVQEGRRAAAMAKRAEEAKSCRKK